LAFANAGTTGSATTGSEPPSSVFLFDQFSSPADAGVLSQQFSDANNLRFLAADDFTVPADQSWQINRVIFSGIFQTTKNASEESGAIWNVRIYTSIIGKQSDLAPANSPMFEATGLSADSSDITSSAFGSVTLTLPNPPTLQAGTYWISVFPTKAGRAFFWQVSTLSVGNNFLVRQDIGLNICPDLGTALSNKWVIPESCSDAFFFSGSNLEITTLTSLVFRLDGQQVGSTGSVVTTGGDGNVVVTTGDGNVVVTTGDGDGSVVVTTGNSGIDVTTGDGNVVVDVGDGSAASTLSVFYL